MILMNSRSLIWPWTQNATAVLIQSGIIGSSCAEAEIVNPMITAKTIEDTTIHLPLFKLDENNYLQ